MVHYSANCLYPEIEPYSTGMLEVSDGHSIYYEEVGNPDGIPVIHFHGGPGYWCAKASRCYFNPEKYRLVQFHQRGCGLSTPLGSLENNTTEHLLNDIEALRKKLGIDKWLLFGGSWGSSLALIYAIRYPDHVSAMLVYSIYLATQKWTDWYLEQNGAELFFPDAYEKLQAQLPDIKGKVPDKVLAQTSGSAGQAIVDWESILVESEFVLTPHAPASPVYADFFDDDKEQLAKVEEAAGKIEMHYLGNKCFIPDDYILSNAGKISDIPCRIIQGRYDMVCPPKQAYSLHKALKNSRLTLVSDAGHKTAELRSFLVQALDRYDPSKPFRS